MISSVNNSNNASLFQSISKNKQTDSFVITYFVFRKSELK